MRALGFYFSLGDAHQYGDQCAVWLNFIAVLLAYLLIEEIHRLDAPCAVLWPTGAALKVGVDERAGSQLRGLALDGFGAQAGGAGLIVFGHIAAWAGLLGLFGFGAEAADAVEAGAILIQIISGNPLLLIGLFGHFAVIMGIEALEAFGCLGPDGGLPCAQSEQDAGFEAIGCGLRGDQWLGLGLRQHGQQRAIQGAFIAIGAHEHFDLGAAPGGAIGGKADKFHQGIIERHGDLAQLLAHGGGIMRLPSIGLALVDKDLGLQIGVAAAGVGLGAIEADGPFAQGLQNIGLQRA